MNIPAPHNTFLENLKAKTESDPRFLGVTVGGSYATGKMDEFSDLDFILIVKDEHYDEMLLQRQAFASSLGKLLIGFTGEHVGEPRLFICFYDEPVLHVDLKFMALEAFRTQLWDVPKVLWEKEEFLTQALKRVKTMQMRFDVQWVEDRFWPWIHYTTCKIGRGEFFETVDCLCFLRARVLAPFVMHLKGILPRGVRHIESLCADRLPLFLKTHPSDTTAKELIRSLNCSIEMYLSLRDETKEHFTIRKEAQKAAIAFLEEISRRDQSPPEISIESAISSIYSS